MSLLDFIRLRVGVGVGVLTVIQFYFPFLFFFFNILNSLQRLTVTLYTCRIGRTLSIDLNNK